MKKYLSQIIIAAILITGSDVQAQEGAASNARHTDPSEVQDGNGVLGTIFDTTLCGLNYATYTRTLSQRVTPPGVTQPALFPISGMPSCSPVVKAYFWCVTAGTGIPITVNITNPDGNSASFLMTVVGQAGDLCWGSTGTYVYRADVTSIISNNGNYVISGLPTTTVLTSANDDTDGGTLLIMYQDLTSSFTGSIHLMDGAIGVLGGTATQNMTGFNSCGNSTGGSAFMGLADLQMAGSTYSMNGSATATYPTYSWLDFISQSTTVTNGQSTAAYTFSSPGDCYCLFLGGLYWQTSCMTCTPSTLGLTVTASSITPATCAGNGAATVTVSGGSGNYAITWNTNPDQYGNSASNLNGGSYMVSVVDSVAGMCGNLLVTIPYTGPVVTVSSTPGNCQANGSATATVTGGSPSYTYNWLPTGGNAATANNLPAGVYTVTVTDSQGCSVTAAATVLNNANLSVVVSVVPDSCPSPSGAATANPAGGQPPYSYLWMPGNLTGATVNGLAAGTYTLTITDGAGCIINSNVVVPYYNNASQVSVTGNTPVVCGGWLTLQASATGPATYSWQPSTYLSASNIANPMCNPFSSITYTLIATSSCGNDTVLVPVIIDSSILLNESVCEVTVDTSIHRCVIVWQHTTTPGFGFFTIYRETTTPAVYVPIATQHSSINTEYTDWTSTPWFGTSRYRIAYTDSCGNAAPATLSHRTMFLSVAPAGPGYNLSWTAYEGMTVGTYNILRGSSIGNMSVIGTVSGTTFTYNDPNPPAGPVYYVIEAPNPSGGCSTNTTAWFWMHSNIWSSTWVGVEENALQASLDIAPNPGNGTFTLNCNTAAGDDVTIVITDALGRTVYMSTDENPGSTFRKEMDLSMLAAGVYNVHVSNGTSEGVTKLVITD